MNSLQLTATRPGLLQSVVMACAAISVSLNGSAIAASLDGQVLGAGAPIADSTVTLWQAGSGTPRQLAQARTSSDGRFALSAPDAPLSQGALYLVARGGTPATG